MAEISDKTKEKSKFLKEDYSKFLFLEGSLSSTTPKSGDSATKIAGKILNLHVEKNKKDEVDEEIKNNFKKQRRDIQQKRYDEIKSTLATGTKKAKESKKAAKPKKEKDLIEKIFGKGLLATVVRLVMDPIKKVLGLVLLANAGNIQKVFSSMLNEINKPFSEIVDDVKSSIGSLIKDTIFDTEFTRELFAVEPKTPDEFPFPENPPEYQIEDKDIPDKAEEIAQPEGKKDVAAGTTESTTEQKRVPKPKEGEQGAGAGAPSPTGQAAKQPTAQQQGAQGTSVSGQGVKDSGEKEKTKMSALPTSGGTSKISASIISKEEGLPKNGKAYWDPPNQKNLVSVGYGHQIKPDEYKQGYIQAGSEQVPIKGEKGIDTVLTPDQAKKVLEQDIPQYEQRAAKPLGDAWNKLDDVQKAALVSYAYNTGSTNSLVKVGLKDAILSGDMNEAAKIIREKGVRTAGGVENKVLVARRNSEAAIFASGKGKVAEDTKTATATKPPEQKQQKQEKEDSKTTTLETVTTKQAGVDTKGIKSSLTDRVIAMAEDFEKTTGKKLQINSGFRSNEDQKKLWDQELAKNNGDVAATKKKVAEPGPPYGNGKGSLHSTGLAIDIQAQGPNGLNVLAGSREKPTGWLEKFGLARPVPKEDWHVQLQGTPATADNPANPGGATLVANKNSSTEVASGKKKDSLSGSDTAPTQMASVSPKTNGDSLNKASTENKDAKKQATEDKQQPVNIIAVKTTNNLIAT